MLANPNLMHTATPSPDLTPDAVVRLQLASLQHNDDPSPNSGIRAAYRFASPANRAHLGPMPRFIRMVKNPMYAPLVNHRHAELGDLVILDDQAHQVVQITTAEGEEAAYVFTLSRQHQGLYTLCWMTDSVVRLCNR